MATVSRFVIFWKVFFAALLGGSAASAIGPEEKNAWNAAVSANTPESYYTYLSLYPAGSYVDAAIAALGELGAVGAPRQIEKVPAPAQPSARSRGGVVFEGTY